MPVGIRPATGVDLDVLDPVLLDHGSKGIVLIELTNGGWT